MATKKKRFFVPQLREKWVPILFKISDIFFLDSPQLIWNSKKLLRSPNKLGTLFSQWGVFLFCFDFLFLGKLFKFIILGKRFSTSLFKWENPIYYVTSATVTIKTAVHSDNKYNIHTFKCYLICGTGDPLARGPSHVLLMNEYPIMYFGFH